MAPVGDAERAFRVIRLIVGAMVVGVVTFAAIVAALTRGDLKAPVGVSALALAVYAMTFIVPFATWLVRGAIVGRERDRIQRAAPAQADAERLLGLFITTVLVRAAGAEAVALFALLVVLVEKNAYAFIPAGLMLPIMLTFLAARSGYARFVFEVMGRAV